MSAFLDHTQSGEQKWIEAFAAKLGRPGRFLDLGAYDGITGSNSRFLAVQGWGGLVVEPAASAFHVLADVYKNRVDVICVQALIARQPGLRTFWYSPTDLVSTTEETHKAIWENDARFVHTVACAVTLDELLAFDGGGFDVVSIDTEGTAISLLEDLRAHPVWNDVGLVVVEFADGEQEYEIHEICGMGEWDVLERTSNNVVLERRHVHDWVDITAIGHHERQMICTGCPEQRTEPFDEITFETES